MRSKEREGGGTPASSVGRAPRVSGWLVRWFTRYVRFYLRRSFHAVRLAKGNSDLALPEMPTLVYINHPSWWDPLICVLLADYLFPGRTHYAPMDAAALGRYRFFSRMGFFPVEPDSARGAHAFMRTSIAILSQPGSVLWVTPQGEFVDARQRPMTFKPGIGHLLKRVSSCLVLPIAIEYPFWNERLPEALVRCGAPFHSDDEHGATAGEWCALLERRLEETLDALREDGLSRDPDRFVTLLRGRTGVGVVYDLWRRFKATLRGERFHASHEERQD